MRDEIVIVSFEGLRPCVAVDPARAFHAAVKPKAEREPSNRRAALAAKAARRRARRDQWGY